MSLFRIERIRIEGFRGVQAPVDISLVNPAGTPVDQFVIAGVNGSGKTSLLEGVLLALGRDELITRDLEVKAREDHWRTTIPGGARLAVDIRAANGGFGFRRSATAHVVRNLETGEEFPYREETIPTAEYFSSWRAPALVGGVRPTVQGRPPDEREANRLRLLKQRIVNQRARRAFGQKGDDERWLLRLNGAWKAFHGGDDTWLDAAVVDPDSEDTEFDLFIMEANGPRCPIDQASSGELELVAIAGTLAMRDDLDLIVIDEPELHLHPDWQGRILPAIRALAPTAQILAATHADAPWDSARTWERVFLAPPGDPRLVRHGGTAP